MMNRIIGTVIAVVIAAGLFRLCAFIVDQKHTAIVFELGHISRVISEPGLNFKLPPPFQNVEYLDKRILTIDSQNEDRVQTAEKKNLLIDSFVKWRIADARNFWVSFHGGEREAEDRINTLVRDAMNQAVNRRTVNDITSRERDKAMEEIRAGVQDRVKDLGVTIVDVRLKRVDFIPEASESGSPTSSAPTARPTPRRSAPTRRSSATCCWPRPTGRHSGSRARAMRARPQFTRRPSAPTRSSMRSIRAWKRTARAFAAAPIC
jgi:regulator of protease activity HflC (stomatin/prohibitin superfamily)